MSGYPPRRTCLTKNFLSQPFLEDQEFSFVRKANDCNVRGTRIADRPKFSQQCFDACRQRHERACDIAPRARMAGSSVGTPDDQDQAGVVRVQRQEPGDLSPGQGDLPAALPPTNASRGSTGCATTPPFQRAPRSIGQRVTAEEARWRWGGVVQPDHWGRFAACVGRPQLHDGAQNHNVGLSKVAS